MSFSFYPANEVPMIDNGESYTLIRPIAGYESLDDMNLSNTNARMVLAALGIDAEEGGTYDLPKFAQLASAWLRANVGARSAEVKSVETRGETGPTMIDCGVREGYLNEKIHALAIMARHGLDSGATLLAWG